MTKTHQDMALRIKTINNTEKHKKGFHILTKLNLNPFRTAPVFSGDKLCLAVKREGRNPLGAPNPSLR